MAFSPSSIGNAAKKYLQGLNTCPGHRPGGPGVYDGPGWVKPGRVPPHPSKPPGNQVDAHNTNDHSGIIMNPKDSVDIKFPPSNIVNDPGFGRPLIPPHDNQCYDGPKTYPTPF